MEPVDILTEPQLRLNIYKETDTNFVTNIEILKRLNALQSQGFLTQAQVLSLEGAIEVSKELYSGIKRRKQFVSHINGHINPGLKTIIDNHEVYTDYLMEDYPSDIPIEELRYFDKNNIRASALYEFLLTYIGHDWYEDFTGTYEELEEIRENQIIKRFGNRIDQNILVISKTGDMNKYREAMDDFGSRLVIGAKSVDRPTNLKDDFSSLDYERNAAYIAETREYLLPLFKKFDVPFYEDIEQLITDLEKDIEQREYAEDIAMKNFVYDFEDHRREDWKEHLEWMIEFLSQNPDMREIMGLKIAILMHDHTDRSQLIHRFLSQMGIDYGEDPFAMEGIAEEYEAPKPPTSPDLAFYATGIAIASSEYDKWSARRRRDPESYSYIEDPNIRARIHEINDRENKAEWNFNQLRESGLLRYIANPVVSMDEILEILEWDIEGMLISVAEKLHNLENPTKLSNGENNAAYQWKIAQELLFYTPLLEIGGLRSLAQHVEGKVNEFLYADILEEEPWIKEEYNRNVEFFEKYGNTIQRVMNSSALITPYTGVVTMNLKSFGSFLKKISLQREEYKGKIDPNKIKIGDAIRCNIIFSGPNDINEEVTMDDLFGMYGILAREFLEGLNKSIPEMTFTNSHPLGNNPIVVRSPEAMYHTISPALLPEMPHEHKSTKAFVGIQNYIMAVPKYTRKSSRDARGDTFYMELQAVSAQEHYDNIFGPESHLEYTLRDKFKMDTSTIDLKALTQGILERVYKYRISPRNAMYLSERSRRELVDRGYCKETDLDELIKPDSELTQEQVLQQLVFID